MWLKEYYEVLGAATKKAQAYTDQEVSKVRTKFAVVASYADLPNPGRTDTIYLVPKAGFVSVYDQYIYENGQYTDIGDTELDLDSYATDLELSQGLATKVDKVEGYGLSKNDFTDIKDTKLAGIETGAQVNVTPDSELNKVSTNAIQNKAVTEKFEEVEAEILNEDQVAEGNPITIQTGSIGTAKSTELTMSPIQDLHGYDKSWAAGQSDQMLDESTAELGTIDQTTGQDVPATGVSRTDYAPTKGATDIFLTSTAVGARFFWYDSSKNYLSNDVCNKNESISVPNSAAYFRIIGVNNLFNKKVMVNSGTTAKTYCPYSNVCPISGRTQADIVVKDEDNVTQSTVTISFGQTVYGGKLDVETGTLIVDIMRVELATLNWNATTSSGVFYADDDLSEYIGVGKTIIACDSLESVDNVSGLGGARTNPDCSICGYSGSSTHRFYIRWDAKDTSVSDLVSALNGVYACYKLATPQTTTLTPAQINLIKGLNNISTDADSIKMTYTINDFVTETEMNTALESKANVIDLNGKADLTSFGPYEAGPIASTNYAEGDYMIFDGKFCKASSAITAGDTLEIGTNLTETTIAAELLAIISQLPTT